MKSTKVQDWGRAFILAMAAARAAIAADTRATTKTVRFLVDDTGGDRRSIAHSPPTIQVCGLRGLRRTARKR
jgi:hypothetical protein